MSEELLDPFNDSLNILNYLDRCTYTSEKMTMNDLQREIRKCKNIIEEKRIAQFQKRLGMK